MKQIDILTKLFGTVHRVKVLKFFLLNQGIFTLEAIAKRLKVKPSLLRNEMILLKKIGLITEKTMWIEVVRRKTQTKKRARGFAVQSDFPLRKALYNLVVESGGMHIPDVASRFSGVGKVELFIVSGIFLNDPTRSVDIMIVGDRLKKSKIEREIKILESEIGKELRYAVFSTSEFMYRLHMYDKLLRDTLEYPHEKVINKIDHPELRG